jgi:hypothetical protein
MISFRSCRSPSWEGPWYPWNESLIQSGRFGGGKHLPLPEFEPPSSPTPQGIFHNFKIRSGGSLSVLVNGTAALPQWFLCPALQGDQLPPFGVKNMRSCVMTRYLVIRRNSYGLIGITSVETEVVSVGSMKIRLLSDRMQDGFWKVTGSSTSHSIWMCLFLYSDIRNIYQNTRRSIMNGATFKHF